MNISKYATTAMPIYLVKSAVWLCFVLGLGKEMQGEPLCHTPAEGPGQVSQDHGLQR